MVLFERACGEVFFGFDLLTFLFRCRCAGELLLAAGLVVLCGACWNPRMSQPSLSFRPAVPDDAPLVHEFILAIAEYEKLSHEVTATVDDIRAALSGEAPLVEVLLAYSDGIPAAFALYYHNFSTFTG